MPSTMRMRVAFAVALLLATLAGLGAYDSMTRRAEHGQWVQHTHAVIRALDALEGAVVTAETAERGYLLTGDVRYLGRGRAAPTVAWSALHQAIALTDDNPAQRATLTALAPIVRDKLDFVAAVLAFATRGARTAALALVQRHGGEELTGRIARLIERAREEERRLLSARLAAEARAAAALRRQLLLLALGAALATVSGAVLLRRHAAATRQALVRATDSETRYRRLVDAMPDAVVVHVDGRIRFANPAAARLLGVSAPAALLGRAMLDDVHPEDRARVLARVRRTAAAGRQAAPPDAARMEERLLRHDTGQPVLVEVADSLVRVQDADGDHDGIQVVLRDVTERRAMDAVLRESEARFRGVLETVRAVAVTLDAAGTITFANDAACALTGWSRAELVGHDWFARCIPEGDVVRAVFHATIAGGAVPPHYENEILTRDGQRRRIAWDNTLLRDATGTVVGTASLGRDVTEARALEAALREREALVRGAIEASLDAVLLYRAVRDRAGALQDFTITHANAAAGALFAMPPEDLIDHELTTLFPVVRTSGLFATFARVLATGVAVTTEYQAQDPRTTAAWVRLQIVRVGDGLAVTARDITGERRALQALQAEAQLDVLTGLYNRRGFQAAAERAWQQAEREGGGVVLVALDLDRFKAINDTFGHAEGDRALQAMADVLRAACRGSDVVGRLGGDEFVALIVPSGPTGAASDLASVERQVRARIAEQLAAANAAAQATGRPYAIGASVGTTSCPTRSDPRRDADGGARLDPPAGRLSELLVRADERLYADKAARRHAAAPGVPIAGNRQHERLSAV